jgi:flagellar biosynthesis protein FlhB
MSANQDLDKTEAATPHKLEQAKDRGNVAKSPDVVGTAILIFATVYLSWKGVSATEQVFGLGQALINKAGRVTGGPELWSLTIWAVKASLGVMAPFLAMTILVVILANWYKPAQC